MCILDSTIYWNILEKSLLYQLFHLFGIDTEPDPTLSRSESTTLDFSVTHSLTIHIHSLPVPDPGYVGPKTEQVYNWQKFVEEKMHFMFHLNHPWRTYQLQRKTPPFRVNIQFFRTFTIILFLLSEECIGFPRTGPYPTESLSGSNSLNCLKQFTCFLEYTFMKKVGTSTIHTWRSSLLIISTSLPSEMDWNSSPSEIFDKR
jgi:hypothetical protein